MKRILFLAADLCSRGAEHQMVIVACLLKNAGYDVSFLCYHKDNFFEFILQNNNIPVKWICLPNAVQRMLKIRKLIRQGHYDVVISFLQTDNFLNDFSALGKHSWSVITGERSSKEAFFSSFRGKIFGFFQKQSDYIVCNSNNAREMWLKYYPKYSEKLRVIYNHAHHQNIASNYIIRKNGKTLIIVAGAYAIVKNPQCVIKAVSLMDQKQKARLRVEWYGKIDASKESRLVYEECENLIQQSDLEGCFYLNDVITDISSKMQEADVVALFSKLEGLPNAICEGMTLGKPILMTRVSDFGVLVDENNGWLCDADSAESIKNALEKILNTPDEELIQKGLSSKEKAVNLFSVQTILNKWVCLID